MCGGMVDWMARSSSGWPSGVMGCSGCQEGVRDG